MGWIARPPRLPTLLLGAGGLLLAAGLAVAAFAGFFDRDPIHLFGVGGRPAPVAAVYFSGDMGLRFGMGPHVAAALTARHIPVLGVSSSTAFAAHRSQAEVDAIVAGSVREALARTGAARIAVMGQSFGSDMLVAGLGALPPDLRARVAAIVLVVPARTIYFRADPSGFSYRGTPDADGPAHARGLTWAPLVCIYGDKEADSLCPALPRAAAKVIALPGGHFLRNDPARLIATIFAALDPILQSDREQRR